MLKKLTADDGLLVFLVRMFTLLVLALTFLLLLPVIIPLHIIFSLFAGKKKRD